MNVNCWDKCFLCLNNFRSSSSSSCGGKKARGRQRSKEITDTERANLSVLIKYLLGTWDQTENDSLLQRIRRLQQLQKPNSLASSCSEGLIKFCDKCQDSARRISNLQMELEVIQMKIVDILWSIRKTVIGNSNGHHDGTSGLKLEEFTEERQEVLDTLHAFQAAVVENSKKIVHVPLVYIEKSTGCNLKTNRATATVTGEEDKFNLIKTEPAADPLDEILSVLGDGYDYAASPAVIFNKGLEDNDFMEEMMDTNNDVNMMPTESGQAPLAFPCPPPPRKRGRPRKNPVHEIKEEQAEFSSLSSEPDGNANRNIKEENFADGRRKPRSVAQTAVKRTVEVKKSSRASFQYRSRKVPNRTKKNKEIDTKTKSKSTPESSSSSTSKLSPHHPHPPNPSKILLNPVLKTGNIFKKTPKQRGGKKSLTSKKASAATPRIKKHLQCELCPYKTVNNFQFEHHLNQHESPEVVNHICHICTNPPRQFSQKQSFDFHMNSHSGLNKMICDLCPKFLDPFGILEHLRGHPEAEKIFQCPCCSYYCGTRESYLKHTRCHGLAALVCDICSKKFRTRQRMLDHMHNEHNLLEKIKCDVVNCDREFLENFALEAHKRLHTQAFVCLECNVQFPKMRDLFVHQVRDHSREKPVRCSECPERFLDKVALQNHAIRAHGAAKFKCPHCPKEFSIHGSLSSHMNLHDEVSFPCDQCNKVFGLRRHLKRHQEVHRTTKDFVCEECGKAFGRAEHLRVHRKIHVGDKKHKCSYCPKGFVDRKNLIVHERIHTGEKPYVCEACGKDFNQRGPLNQHMRTQHKELIPIENKSEVIATDSTSTSTKEELNINLN